MAAPLEGIRVLDLTWNLPGPYATFLLASLGARVTKVEPPRGDPARHMPRLFEALNRGKGSLVVDLRTDAGRETLLGRMDQADVVLEGFRPGVAARLGCDAATARARNPRLVYCSISAFGQDGPRRDLPGHDLNVQALAGVCHMARDAAGNPHGLALPIADFSAATGAVASINAALFARERTGEGATLDVAMVDGPLSWATLWSDGVNLAAQAEDQLPPGLLPIARHFLMDRLDRERLHALPHYDTYPCRDGKWIAIGIVDEKHFWKGLCDTIGLPRLARVPMSARAALGPVLKRLIARKLRRRDRASWLERLETAGVCVTPVLTPDEARREPHLRARLVDPTVGVRAPLAGASAVHGTIPALGEDGAPVAPSAR